ncbi:hypothetical protein LIER_33864 [Lithospermum erythrorhizon]|uniref:Uncharacterized protein n=1 Tax=Lithospermum erythrorhizon TaxID=34254 RepID=A0AAV3RXW0_LITER
MQPVTNNLERTVDMTKSTTPCAEKRSHDNVSNSFPSNAKRKKIGSIRKSTTNVVGKSDEPVKDTSASLMVSQLLQHLAPKDDKEHPDSDFSALYLDKDAEDNLDR